MTDMRPDRTGVTWPTHRAKARRARAYKHWCERQRQLERNRGAKARPEPERAP